MAPAHWAVLVLSSDGLVSPRLSAAAASLPGEGVKACARRALLVRLCPACRAECPTHIRGRVDPLEGLVTLVTTNDRLQPAVLIPLKMDRHPESIDLPIADLQRKICVADDMEARRAAWEFIPVFHDVAC